MNPKIDLTENRDFRKPGEYTRDLVDFPYGQYKLTRLTSIFGRCHIDQRFRIFGVIGYIKRCESRCNRCGKFIIPWKRLNSGLCPKCESDLDRSFSLLPWKNKLTTNSSTSNSKDIFNMK